MKKTFLPFLLLLLATLCVSAIPTPHPIYGKITSDNFAVKDAVIQLETRTGTVETTTNSNGFYQFEMANIDDGWRTGDTVTVSLKYCSGIETCSQEVILSDNGGDKVTWDIASIIDEEEQPVPVPDTVEILKIQCWNGQMVSDISQCPVELKTCEDGSKVELDEDCPNDNLPYQIALGILAGLIAIAAAVISKFKWGPGMVGLSNYWKKKGDEAVKRGDYAQAQKHYVRAAKMLGTTMERAKEGLYKKSENV